MKKTKLLVLILSLALLIGGVVGISASAAEGEVTSIEIYKKNVSFMKEPAIVFAVLHDGSAENVSLKVWNTEPQSDEAAPDYTVTDSYVDTVVDEVCSVFAVNGKHPKNIAENVWVQAVAGDVKTDVVRYSILEFALSGMALEDEWYDLYKSTLDYSANVQKAVGYTDANGKYATDYAYVSVVDGQLADGSVAGVYMKGDIVTPVLSVEAPSGYSFDGWTVTKADGTSATVTDGAAITVDESIKIEPIYTKKLTFEDGAVGDKVTSSGGTISIIDQDRGSNNKKALSFVTEAGSADYLTIALTENAPATLGSSFVAVYESDMYILHRSGSSAYGFDIYLTNENRSRAYRLNGAIKDGLNFCDISASSGGVSGETKANVVGRGSWFKFKLEYHYSEVEVDGEMVGTATIYTYFNNQLLYEGGSTNYYGSNGGYPASKAVTRLEILPYSNLGADIYLDNISFYITEE